MLPFFSKKAKRPKQLPGSGTHVFLTGFMGSGKTTVGKILATNLGREFLDLDDVLEKEYGKSISEVFDDPNLGEADFRRRELAKIKGFLSVSRSPKVIALGGGSIMNPEIRDALKTKAFTFYLAADDPALLYARVTNESVYGKVQNVRPNARDREKFEKLFNDRLLYYRGTGIPVDATLPPERIADIIGDTLVKRTSALEVKSVEKSVIKTFLTRESMLDALRGTVGNHKCLILLDSALYNEEVLFSQAFGARGHIYKTSQMGEAAKNMTELMGVLEALSRGSFDRSDYLVVRGGGSLSDLGAMAAGLFKRGIKLIILPTTMLSAVDAAIGGKAAVNFQGAKNQIGIFYLPEEIIIEGQTIGSLSLKLLEEGLTEAFKMGLIMDKELHELIVRNLVYMLKPIKLVCSDGLFISQQAEKILEPGDDNDLNLASFDHTPVNDIPLLLDIAFRSASLKMEVVASDYHEELGIRDKLNFGHTWGHVVESFHAATDRPVSHGQAVACGMAVALLYSEKHFNLKKAFAKICRSTCLTLAGGEFPDFPEERQIQELVYKDKKIRDGKLKFIVLPEPHHSQVVEIKPESLVECARELYSMVESKILRPL
ncbi:MAG: hypothetical protein LBE27_07230 [Deltaproteobacteria bacterium]|jgi:3-dehydroquinate synthetase|nr:hypothetical protein [Deltaproteobacteria bacterium]